MAQKLMTPGVYIEEVNAFPGSVVEVATAIPAFIGYTERASRNGKSLVNQPVRITSFAEYLVLFGGAFQPKFTLDPVEKGKTYKHLVTINGVKKAINYVSDHDCYMFRGIQLFYNNGGGTCYIVSVGTYETKSKVEVLKPELEAGLATLLKEQEPTMIVIPDAVKLKSESYDLYQQVLKHCAKMQSRVAILDVYNGDEARVVGDSSVDLITYFRENIGSENLNYAAAYYPWLNTTIVQKNEITFENLYDSPEDQEHSVNLASLLNPVTESKAIDLVNAYPKDDARLLQSFSKDKPVDFAGALKKDLEAAAKISPAVVPPVAPQKVEKPAQVAKPAKEVIKPEPVVTKPADLGEEATEDEKAAYEASMLAFTEYTEKLQKFEEYEKLLKAYTDYQKIAGEYETYVNSVKTYFADLSKFLKTNGLTEVTKLLPDYLKNVNRNFHQGLIATSPTYSNLLDEIRTVLNILPPSAAMAGIYTSVDNSRGVWKSPANISVNSVLKPTTNITHDEQENLNVDAISGKSINAIRTFPGIGTLVWGGRTLDGNSLDWKYINVRRTMIMLEQSIKLALRSYVFEPNDANTWVSVKSMIINFLTEKWKQGALAGASPSDAFDVQVGLGATMTGLDILEGKMLVSVKLAIVRPAEFIVVTFEQQMQKS